MSTDSHDVDVDQLTEPGPVGPAEQRSDSAADCFMRRVLRLPVDGPKASPAEARSAFQTSIAVATVRCLLMYIVFPFVLPAVGVASGVGPVVGLLIGIAAVIAITMSIRRFWRADHSKRWHYTVVGGVVLVFMVYLIVKDVVTLLS